MPGIGQDRAHPICKLARERQPSARIGGDLRIAAILGDRGDRLVLAHALEAQEAPGKDERVAGGEADNEVLLDLAQPPTARAETHAHQGRLDDRPDIHPVLARETRVAKVKETVLAPLEAAVTLVDTERVAAVRDELDHRIEIGSREAGIGCCRAHLVKEPVRIEGTAAGDARDVLRQHVQAAMRNLAAVEVARVQRLLRGDALQHLEAVGRDQDGTAGLVQAVVGATDALEQAGGTFRRSDLDDEVDVAPVDAEVERGGADDGAQAAPCHDGLDLAALLDGEAPVMKRYRQVVPVLPPQRAEHQLGLGPRVDEDQDRARGLDEPVDLGNGVECQVPGPGHIALRHDHADVGRGTRLASHDLHAFGCRGEEALQARRMCHRSAEPDDPGAGRQPPQPRQAEAQERTSLALGDGVQLVQDDGAKPGEEGAGILVGEQKGQRLGRREQDVGRMTAHARATVLRRVARARRMGDGQRHLGQRRLEVAADVGREGLERRDVEGVQALAAAVAVQLDEARQEPCERLAAAGGCDQESVASLGRDLEHARLMLS